MDPHTWLQKNFPKKGICEHCGKEKKTDYAFRFHGVKEHSFERDDYQELCRKCHGADHREQGCFIGRVFSDEHKAKIGASVKKRGKSKRHLYYNP